MTIEVSVGRISKDLRKEIEKLKKSLAEARSPSPVTGKRPRKRARLSRYSDSSGEEGNRAPSRASSRLPHLEREEEEENGDLPGAGTPARGNHGSLDWGGLTSGGGVSSRTKTRE